MTSISDNEMNIQFQIPLCNVRHLNGILKISLEIYPKNTQLKKKIQNTWETIVISSWVVDILWNCRLTEFGCMKA